MEAVCRKTLQDVNRDLGAKPAPKNFRKILYVRQNRRVLPPIADDRRALRLLMTGLKLVVG
jgi:hypothetical protein